MRPRAETRLEPPPVPAMRAEGGKRENPLTRSMTGMIGIAFLAFMIIACVGSLPWTLGVPGDGAGAPRYVAGDANAGRIPPAWWPADAEQKARLRAILPEAEIAAIAAEHGVTPGAVVAGEDAGAAAAAERAAPDFLLGTDVLGRSLLVRCLTGGGISLGIGIAAAFISVLIGTVYGGISGYVGGKTDAVLMRIVDILYGLPYILLVVLLAVASEAVVEEQISRSGAREKWAARVVAELGPVESGAAEVWLAAPATGDDELVAGLGRRLSRAGVASEAEAIAELSAAAADLTRGGLIASAGLRAVAPREMSDSNRVLLDVGTLLLAIGGVSWLTMARVIRGQVMSLKGQQFVEAARATGVSPHRLFVRHLLPNLVGPIIVYATLTVPQAILQESFLSFLGIGVKPPLPSWGNLAADGLSELNTYRSNWWLLFFPCLLLGLTLLALNFVGEGLREAFDPKRARR